MRHVKFEINRLYIICQLIRFTPRTPTGKTHLTTKHSRTTGDGHCTVNGPGKLNQRGSKTVLCSPSSSLTFDPIAKSPQLARGAQDKSVMSGRQKIIVNLIRERIPNRMIIELENSSTVYIFTCHTQSVLRVHPDH